MSTIENALLQLNKSSFRRSLKLNNTDLIYIKEKGLDTIRKHAYDFVIKKLKPDMPLNDTKQTPFKGHPVFKAMHACACCCRKCLNRWYRVPMNVELDDESVKKIVNLLMAWIEKQLDN